ncbi:unnamed protein product [Clonostachys chloroleuca]|uniref:Peptidase S33 tripeptidyl aminopeptidase-like C-terminal domain-containing protein n=1 Tax=Clonostachys chloroleuca TaxID=1926264 RepID=A0AA35QBF5_9HYPO|nr:unnamed protein product [Clonostachys chloroleuca]
MYKSVSRQALLYGFLLKPILALPQTRDSNETTFNWASIQPSSDLQYNDCYNGYKCARLEVPLDWQAANQGNGTSLKAAIAIVTLPATVREDDPSFGGTILVNPGGPGGSGTEFVLSEGAYLQSVVDEDKHYNILGFDPRGVGLSTPSADCYRNDFARASDAIQQGGLSPADPDTFGLKMFYETAKGVSNLCAELGPESIFPYMATASVARDMLEIVERVDELEKKTFKCRRSQNTDELPKLQYLGFSYGSFLGNSFASLFPGRVGRMVIDGVVDADDYIQAHMGKALLDAEKVLDTFYETCYDAGSSCLLREDTDKSAKDIRNKVDLLIKSLDDDPVSIVYQGRVRHITSHTVRDVLRQMLYQPIVMYEPASQLLALALTGNFTGFMQTPTSLANSIELAEMCVNPGASYPPSDLALNNEAGYGTFCSDTYIDPDLRNATWANNIAKAIVGHSPTLAESWTRVITACSGWNYDAKYAFRGPFGAPGPDKTGKNKDTPSAPLLILSNRYDHATPLSSAYVTSQQHGDSAVIVQEASGHCALLVSSSKCVKDHVATYFATGVVPANNTVCQPDCKPGIPYKECPGFVSS